MKTPDLNYYTNIVRVDIAILMFRYIPFTWISNGYSYRSGTSILTKKQNHKEILDENDKIDLLQNLPFVISTIFCNNNTVFFFIMRNVINLPILNNVQ